MQRLFLTVLFTSIAFVKPYAQTLQDGQMMSKGDLCTGFLYSHEQWKNYWEGSLKRDNQNIGTLSTSGVAWVGVYGVNSKLNVMAMVPYVATNASKGTLMGLNGVQDLTLGAKYQFLQGSIRGITAKFFAAGAMSTPLTDYTPDYLPLSIGLASTTLAGRVVMHLVSKRGWYLNLSQDYTWRSNVTLDRPSYFTDNQIFFTNEVRMHDQVNSQVSFGYQRKNLIAEIYYREQLTLGGSDIRRQDMPFVSNKMNFSRAGAMVLYYLPKPKNLAVRGEIMTTLAGRNVGQATGFSAGLLYTFHFKKSQNQ